MPPATAPPRRKCAAHWILAASGILPAASGILLAACGILLAACGSEPAPVSAKERHHSADPPRSAIRFTETTEASGIHFHHENGKTPTRYLIETMGGGAALADLDGDGLPDAFLANSCPIPIPPGGGPGNAFFHNRGDGTFEDRTESSGLRGGGYGQGVAVADADGDGDLDVYVTRVGPNQLFRNEGGGRFVEVAGAAGAGDPRWSVSAAFLDADRDGILDLYTGNYIRFDFATYRSFVREGMATYPHPDLFAAVPDVFYHGRGDGTFVKATREAGLFHAAGKALGVVAGDLDGDGDTDLYVANDSTPNTLFRNRGDGTFDEVATLAGVAFSAGGASEAGMGVDAGDVDGDLLLDILTTNFNGEGTTLYRARPDGGYDDVSVLSGVARYTLPHLGFGAGLLDLDMDGDLDVFQTNGHVLDNIDRFVPGMRQAQRCQVLENDGTGRFHEITEQAGPDLLRPIVGRAAAFADIDGDGDPDVLVAANGGAAHLFRNDSAPQGASLVLELHGVDSPRDPIGARVVLETSRGRVRRDVLGGRSYAGASDRAVLFAVPEGTTNARATITWPSGRVEPIGPLRAGERVRVVEGSGIASRGPLRKAGGPLGGARATRRKAYRATETGQEKTQ